MGPPTRAFSPGCHIWGFQPKELMPSNDSVAISFYLFFIGETPDEAFQWLTDNLDSFGKPYTMVKTNANAEVRPE